MDEVPKLGQQRIQLDGDWALLEFSSFGKEYSELYSFYYALQHGVEIDDDDFVDGRVWRAFTAYPWRGGWSSLDFFNDIRSAVPKKYRPRVKAIQYASPGYIDLTVVQDVALSVAIIVGAVCFAINRANNTFRNIQKGIRDKRLGDVDVTKAERSLTTDEITFIDKSTLDLANVMKLEHLEIIGKLNPSKLGTLKILLAVYRRASILAKLQDKGKLRLPPESKPPQ